MWNVIKNGFFGALIGVAVSVVIYVVGFAIEILNCSVQIIRCNCNSTDVFPFMWNWSSFKTFLIFITIGCAIIGGIYGFCIELQERKEEEQRKMRLKTDKMLQERKKNKNDLQADIYECLNTFDDVFKSINKFMPEVIDYDNKNVENCLHDLIESYDINAELLNIIEDIDEQEEK